MEALATKIGIEEQQLRFMSGLLAGSLVSGVHRMRSLSTNARHLISIISGVIIGYFVFGWTCPMNTFIMTMVPYSIMQYGVMTTLNRRKKSPDSSTFPFHHVILIYCLIHLGIVHVYRMKVAYGEYVLEQTSILMILLIKIHSIACDVYDGLALNDDKNRSSAIPPSDMPSVLGVLGCCWFYGGYFSGPAIRYQAYLLATHRKEFDGVEYPKAWIWRNVAARTSLFMMCMMVVVVATKYFPLTFTYSDDIWNYNILYRLVYTFMAVECKRFPYYVAWAASEAMIIHAGVGLRRTENKPVENESVKILQVDQVQTKKMYTWVNEAEIYNMYFLKSEGATSFVDLAKYWNAMTAVWLRNYVYLRLPGKTADGKPAPWHTLATTSIWHGFYPGYFITFGVVAFQIEAGRRVRRLLRDRVVGTWVHPIYHVAGWFGVQFGFNLIASAFMVLTWERSMMVMHRLYYTPYIMTAVILIAASMFKPPKSKKSEKEN